MRMKPDIGTPTSGKQQMCQGFSSARNRQGIPTMQAEQILAAFTPEDTVSLGRVDTSRSNLLEAGAVFGSNGFRPILSTERFESKIFRLIDLILFQDVFSFFLGGDYPLVNVYMTMENHHFDEDINYFYGHFQQLFLYGSFFFNTLLCPMENPMKSPQDPIRPL